MKRLTFLLLLSISIVTCKNNAQSTIKSNIDKNTLKVLPDEIANKTWIYINSTEKKWFKTMLEYNDWEYIDSKTHPIAEIEILDNNTIKKKWLGFYNLRTKKNEDYGQEYGWDDKCDGIIKRVEQTKY
ncbi:hypothetical protein [Aquimarina aquimarini]|uniref:hypothetical protein n=1 Tax=Aquimarina aquimarini TaxID=1191734 RepID=UPI001F1891BB|nr:hypothetical protein [Aquimarina aquimarini]